RQCSACGNSGDRTANEVYHKINDDGCHGRDFVAHQQQYGRDELFNCWAIFPFLDQIAKLDETRTESLQIVYCFTENADDGLLDGLPDAASKSHHLVGGSFPEFAPAVVPCQVQASRLSRDLLLKIQLFGPGHRIVASSKLAHQVIHCESHIFEV